MTIESPIVFDYSRVKIIPGWTNFYELSLLGIAAKLSPAKSSLVEFGSFCGRNSTVMANNLNEDCDLFCVDLWNSTDRYPLDKLVFNSQDFDQKLLSQTFEQVAERKTWEIVWRRFVPQLHSVKRCPMDSFDFDIPSNTSLIFIDDFGLKSNLEKYLSKIEDLDECLVILHLRDHREFAFNLLNTRFGGYSAQRNFYYPVNTDMFVLSPKQGHWSKLFSFLVLRYCNRLLYMQTLEEKEKFYEEQLQEQN